MANRQRFRGNFSLERHSSVPFSILGRNQFDDLDRRGQMILMFGLILIISILFIIPGCGSKPEFLHPRPWLRTLGSSSMLSVGSSVSVQVTGLTSTLLGDEEILQKKLKKSLIGLLERRGFTHIDSDADFLMTMKYKSDKADEFTSKPIPSSLSVFDINTSDLSTQSYGVRSAIDIRNMIKRSRDITNSNQTNLGAFYHSLSLDIKDSDYECIWKGEATWWSEDVDICRQVVPVMQTLLACFPSNSKDIVRVEAIRAIHADVYYRLKCQNQLFMCPALPFYVYFPSYSKNDFSIPSSINNQDALAAFVDLIHTAENAVPTGKVYYKDPLNPSAWRSVLLLRKYYLNRTNTPVNVMIKLTLETDGYHVRKCWLAKDKEFDKYYKNQRTWIRMLESRYAYGIN